METNFTNDLNNICSALQDGGWIREIDGFSFISPDAPADLVRLHSNLTSYGYANGLI